MSTDALQGPHLSEANEVLAVAKGDVLKAWAVLERLVVSLDKIGSHYAVPLGQECTAERTEAMWRTVGEYVDTLTFSELAEARGSLSRWLENEEADEISDSLHYWTAPAQPPADQL